MKKILSILSIIALCFVLCINAFAINVTTTTAAPKTTVTNSKTYSVQIISNIETENTTVPISDSTIIIYKQNGDILEKVTEIKTNSKGIAETVLPAGSYCAVEAPVTVSGKEYTAEKLNFTVSSAETDYIPLYVKHVIHNEVTTTTLPTETTTKESVPYTGSTTSLAVIGAGVTLCIAVAAVVVLVVTKKKNNRDEK